MSITTEQWQKIEENLTTGMASVKFQMGSDAITVKRVLIKENRLALAVYINDQIVWMHGMQRNEQSELICKVWRKRTVATYSPVKKQKIIKGFGKRRAKELFPSLDKVTTYYDPMFNTAKSVVRQFKKLDGLVVTKIGFEEVSL